MKKIFFSIAVLFGALTVSAQTSTKPPQGQVSIVPKGKIYGEKVDVKTAHPVGDLAKYMGTRPSITSTVSGKVTGVAKNGETLTIKDNTGKAISVGFQKAGFKFPPNLVGKTVLIDGIISKQYTSTEGTPAGRNKGTEDAGGYHIAAKGVQLMN
ncbi:MAG: DUF4920 domain-containing protein [Janthinobacterium lividum]